MGAKRGKSEIEGVEEKRAIETLPIAAQQYGKLQFPNGCGHETDPQKLKPFFIIFKVFIFLVQ